MRKKTGTNVHLRTPAAAPFNLNLQHFLSSYGLVIAYVCAEGEVSELRTVWESMVSVLPTVNFIKPVIFLKP